jgi:hypothetical protein
MGEDAPGFFIGQTCARVDLNRPPISTQCSFWLQRRPEAARRTIESAPPSV